jgi:hypothetical protein
VDFTEFRLARAVHVGTTAEKCVTDSLFILNTEGGWNEPLCEMENHTAIVFVNASLHHHRPVQFVVVAQSSAYRWNIKITQVNCKKLKEWRSTSFAILSTNLQVSNFIDIPI